MCPDYSQSTSEPGPGVCSTPWVAGYSSGRWQKTGVVFGAFSLILVNCGAFIKVVFEGSLWNAKMVGECSLPQATDQEPCKSWLTSR